MSLTEQCRDCQLSGMDAVRCKIFDGVDLFELQRAEKNCGSPYDSASTNDVGGSSSVSDIRKFNDRSEYGLGVKRHTRSTRIGRRWRIDRETKE